MVGNICAVDTPPHAALSPLSGGEGDKKRGARGIERSGGEGEEDWIYGFESSAG